MLKVTHDGNLASIDVRDRIRRGEHPRGEIVKFVLEAEKGTVVEVHLPHRAQPLVEDLKAAGINSIMNEVEPGHFRLMCVKL